MNQSLARNLTPEEAEREIAFSMKPMDASTLEAIASSQIKNAMDLREELTVMTGDVKNLEDEVESLITSSATLRTRLAEAKQTIGEQAQDIARMREERDDARANVKDLAKRMIALREQVLDAACQNIHFTQWIDD